MSQRQTLDDAALDDVHGALSHPTRRNVLKSLPAAGESLSLSALCDAVRSRSDDDRIDEDDLALSLVHVHLPKLDGMGLVHRHEESSMVSLASNKPMFSNLDEDGLFDIAG